MGRKLKRVPLDFAWPLKQVWEGYLNPYHGYSHDCPDCGGTGYSKAARRFEDEWYGKVEFSPESTGSTPFSADNPTIKAMAERNVRGRLRNYTFGIRMIHDVGATFYSEDEAIRFERVRLVEHFNGAWCHHLNQTDVQALVDTNSLMDFTHTWTPETRWQPKDPPYVPTAAEVNQWSLAGMSHGSINMYVCVKARCKRERKRLTCPACKGKARIVDDEEKKRAYDRWKPTEPPTGDGWQLWESVSEGSPMSSVFATRDGLADWMVEHEGHTRKGVEAFLDIGWSPSAALIDGKFMSGVDAEGEI